MNWLVLLIIGLIVLAVGWYAPLPPPIPIVVRWLGAILIVIALILLIVFLLGPPVATVPT